MIFSFDSESRTLYLQSGVIAIPILVPKKVGMSMESRLESMKSLLFMAMHCVDKVRRFRLSKEAKQKAEKNRQRVQESFLKVNEKTGSEFDRDCGFKFFVQSDYSRCPG